MAKLVYTERFVADASEVWSPHVETSLRQALDALATFPLMGSPNVPTSTEREFGNMVRKIVVRPFEIIYEYVEDSDIIYVEALILERSVR